MTVRSPKTFSQWQDLRRSNPRQYYRSQRKVVEDRILLGETAFYDKKPSQAETDRQVGEALRLAREEQSQ